MKQTRYETLYDDVDFSLPTVFLAGPTIRGNQPHLISWRFEAVSLFENKGFNGQLIIPEFIDKRESDQFRYDIPMWEFNGLKNSHVILFWVCRTRESIGLTTNHELGYWMARDRNKVVYGRPNDAYRTDYCDIMWVEDLKDRFQTNSGCSIYTTLEKTVDAALEKLKPRKGII
jgi:nucleoside 2-deoxyribosyltransferase